MCWTDGFVEDPMEMVNESAIATVFLAASSVAADTQAGRMILLSVTYQPENGLNAKRDVCAPQEHMILRA